MPQGPPCPSCGRVVVRLEVLDDPWQVETMPDGTVRRTVVGSVAVKFLHDDGTSCVKSIPIKIDGFIP